MPIIFFCKNWLIISLLLFYGIFIICGIQLLRKATVLEYSDSADYHSVTLQRKDRLDFWAGRKAFTAPLIWRALQVPAKDDIQASYRFLPAFYAFFSLLSWSLLAGAVLLIIQVPWLKILSFAIILGMGLSRMIFFWNWTLLSESLCISGLVLLIAAGLFLIHFFHNRHHVLSWKQQLSIAFFLNSLLFFWSFTRDTNIVALLGLSGILAITLAFFWKKIQTKTLFFALIAGCIFTVTCQVATIQFSERWKYPFVNILSQRILPVPEYRKFFIDRGFPENPDALRFSGQWANSYDGDWSGFRNWLETKARPTQLQFLLLHPGYTFLEPLKNWEDLIDGDWSSYGKTTVHNSLQNNLTNIVWPHGFSLALLAFFAFVLMGIATLLRRLTMYIFFAFTLLLLAIPGVFSIWHGDAMEIIRHSVSNSLQIKLSLLLIFIFSFDALLKKSSQKLNSKNSLA